MIKNLQQLNYDQKSAVKNIIAELAKDIKDAYRLSILLIASALQGDANNYQILLEKIQKAVDELEDGAFKAWILGRMLHAADSINDEKAIKSVQLQLLEQIDIKNIETKQSKPSDTSMYAWACGYLAALNNNQYKERKNDLEKYLTKLVGMFLDEPGKHELLSDAVWAQIMALQAAANSRDEENYKTILNQMMNLTQKPTISEALETALTWTNESSDYRAWGMSLVRSAAAKIKDIELYQELEKPLINAIREANERDTKQNPGNQWKTKAEATLGFLNNILAEAEGKKLLAMTSLNSPLLQDNINGMVINSSFSF